MARSSRDDRKIVMVHVAEMYYYEQMTQSAIADRLSLSRWTVSRMLEEARDSGLVRIWIDHPLARQRGLEEALVAAFPLDRAVVVPAHATAGATIDAVCAAAADQIATTRPLPKTVGVSWGRTLARVAHQLRQGWNPGVTIAQTNGGVAITRNDLVGRSVVLAAERGRGSAMTLQAPTILETSRLCSMLREEGSVRRTLDAAGNADMIVFSPGPVDDESVLVAAGHISATQMSKLAANGAGADVMSHFVDMSGRVVDPELDSRTLSVDIETMRCVKRRVAVGAGAAKVTAMETVLRAGLCSEVVIDSSTAQAVLGEQR